MAKIAKGLKEGILLINAKFEYSEMYDLPNVVDLAF